MNEKEFWSIKDMDKLDQVLILNFEVLRIVSILLIPFAPELAHRVLDCLKINKEERYLKFCGFKLEDG